MPGAGHTRTSRIHCTDTAAQPPRSQPCFSPPRTILSIHPESRLRRPSLLGSAPVPQYEQHLRAVLGWPLGDPSLVVGAAIMQNILGEGSGPEALAAAHRVMGAALATPGAAVHWCGRSQTTLFLAFLARLLPLSPGRLRSKEERGSVRPITAFLMT